MTGPQPRRVLFVTGHLAAGPLRDLLDLSLIPI